MKISIIILIVVGIIIIAGIKRRGYFIKDKKGRKVTFKQFNKRWKDGIINTTPLQQTRITLFSYMPMFAGLLWGIVVTFLGKTYWLTLILCGSLPITSIQFLSNIQKYRAQKKVKELMDAAEIPEPKAFLELKKKRKKK